MSNDADVSELDQIHNKLWNYLSKISEEEKESWKIESFSHLRNLLSNEMNILLNLYKPLDNLIKDNLKSDRSNKGIYLYNEWGRSGKKEFMTSYYENEYFRAVYAKNRFLNSATSFIQALILRIIPHMPDIETFLINDVKSVISVGVGPGSDIAGFMAFLHSRNVDRQIVYYTMDQCQHWGEYVLELDRAWLHKYRTSIWFKQCRFGSKGSLESLPNADMIVFSFANTINMDINIWPELAQRYKFVMILDGIKDAMISSIEMANYAKFRLNEKNFAYFTFNKSSTAAGNHGDEASATSIASIIDDTSLISIGPQNNGDGSNTSIDPN